MASNKKNEQWKSLTKNIKKLKWFIVLEISEKFQKKCLSPEVCSVTKYRHHHAVSFLYFSENCEKAAPQSPEKSLMGMEILKEKISCNLWFSLPDMKVTLISQLSEKFMSVKIHIFKNASVVKLYSGICRYFAKHLKIGLIYLIAERIIFQYSFCQKPY